MTEQKNSIREERFASPQEQLPPYYVSMRELQAEPHRYIVIPSFQRQEVWYRRQRQALIDTILLGESVPQLEGYQSFSETGESFWYLIDGHQRMTSVLRFMAGEFKTWTAQQKAIAEPNSDPPVEPGRYFDQLSPIAKNYFLNYRLTIIQVRNKSETQLATRFRRIQNHVPLTAAERYNSYISRAKDAAKQIEQHPFWEDFYDGDRKREQVFQSSLHLIGLEAAMPKLTVELNNGGYMYALACGRHDHLITETLVDTVLHKLDQMSSIYHGAHFTQRSAVIAMYQSIGYIEQVGYQIQTSDKGKLATWLMNVLAEYKRGGTPSYANQIQQLLHESSQIAFWERYLPSVLSLFGLSESWITRQLAQA
jgi:hypothetical protein